MRLALKYGLMITCVVVVWMFLTHFAFPIAPQSKLNALGPVLFNLAAILAIYLAIKAKKAETGEVTFKNGVRTGLAVSFFYAASACLVFFILLLIVGPSILANEPTASSNPSWKDAVGPFVGMFFGSLILGLVYSTVISFFLAKRNR